MAMRKAWGSKATEKANAQYKAWGRVVTENTNAKRPSQRAGMSTANVGASEIYLRSSKHNCDYVVSQESQTYQKVKKTRDTNLTTHGDLWLIYLALYNSKLHLRQYDIQENHDFDSVKFICVNPDEYHIHIRKLKESV